ncbi:MAG: STAS domain-containing protein [Spirochaetes bacterium]|nr:STAS domain-containing protein [Spirochaetota bacterium]
MENARLQTVLEIHGSLGIESVRELASGFSRAIRETGDIHVVLSNISDIELTGIQLLYAAAKEAAMAGKRITFSGILDSRITIKLASAGFLKEPLTDAADLHKRLAGFPVPEEAK